MGTAARDRMARLLDEEAAAAASVELKAATSDLRLAVEGIGPVPFPVTPATARKLIAAGQPARFGRGEDTLTDKAVRDTWEIPKHLVRASWDEAVLEDALATARDELGLPYGCSLTADFHSLLVYAKGQFFVAHQDTEKSDQMIGTMVVTAPSTYTGGDLLIGHGTEWKSYRGSKTALSLVAFYADLQHEVLPVKSGYRITLTYNLLLSGDTSRSGTDDDPDAGILADLLGEHFSTPVPRHYGEPPVPPNRLVYLLDHEYTPRGLSWSRLKGDDASRAALLRDAAGRAGCEAVLALADIRETHGAFESGYDAAGTEAEYDIHELIDSTVSLIQWTGPDGKRPEEISLAVRSTEVCSSTPSDDLEPYSSEYEGYMGNWGNTLDRWYHRAAVVVWPREQAFANRAETSPAWALDWISAQAASGDVAGARGAAATLAPFWDAAASGQDAVRDQYVARTGGAAVLFGKALLAGLAVGDADTAGMLLRPFRVERLTVADAAPLAGLAGRYGDRWAEELVLAWFGDRRSYFYASGMDRAGWVAALPSLCSALAAGGAAGAAVAGRLLELSWDWLRGEVGNWLASQAPGQRAARLGDLGQPLAAVLASAGVKSATGVRESVAEFAAARGDEALPWLLAALRAASAASALPEPSVPAGAWRDGAFPGLAAECAVRLRTRLARPRRADDDWSAELPAGCTCELCATLGEFLRDPARRVLDWPLAKPGRQHIHSRIDAAELPVTHETRRQGSPYTLVLAKTGALFERERKARTQDAADLEWLVGEWRPRLASAVTTPTWSPGSRPDKESAHALRWGTTVSRRGRGQRWQRAHRSGSVTSPGVGWQPGLLGRALPPPHCSTG
jgi:predicted 2-oxoglutarate/Fe(II)-dependent dioxygenase YbiX